jgi:hypothetical protein
LPGTRFASSVTVRSRCAGSATRYSSKLLSHARTRPRAHCAWRRRARASDVHPAQRSDGRRDRPRSCSVWAPHDSSSHECGFHAG